MKRFTVFTGLYLLVGICFSILAFQYPDITPKLKQTLLLNAGFVYLCAILSTFRFWRQPAIRRQNSLPSQIAPWFLIGSGLYFVVYSWIIQGIVSSSLGLMILLLGIERLYWRNKLR